MLSFFDRLKTWWTSADPRQRVVTLGGVGALLLLLVGTAFFATRPHYVTLVDGLSETDKSNAVSALETAGFKVGIDRQGAIEIAEGDRAKAQMALAKAGPLKGNQHWGQNDLTKAGPFTSPEVERETLKSILEGEIATSIESAIEGVASARVIITSPKQSVFAEDKTPPSASVTIVENGGGMLTRDAGRTIANLVCGAVEGLRAEDVIVVSNVMGELWNGKTGEVGGSKAEIDDKVAHGWEAKLQAALDPVFGAGNTRVIVRADVDTARRHTKEHQVTPAPKPTTVSTRKESMVGSGKAKAGGVAGAASNVADGRALQTPANAGAEGNKYDQTDTQKEFANNEVDRVTEDGVGDLKGLSITVVANSEKVPDEKAVKKIVDGVMGGKIQLDASGAPMPNQAFTTTVTSVKFDGASAQAAKEATDRSASQQRTQQILSLLPIAAILLVALLVAKQVGKISRAVLPPPPVTVSVREIDGLPGGGLEAYDSRDPMMRDALPAPYEADGTLALPSEYPVEEEPEDLELVVERVNRSLEGMKKVADEKPELVANMIKSMLLGERA